MFSFGPALSHPYWRAKYSDLRGRRIVTGIKSIVCETAFLKHVYPVVRKHKPTIIEAVQSSCALATHTLWAIVQSKIRLRVRRACEYKHVCPNAIPRAIGRASAQLRTIDIPSSRNGK